MSESIYKGVSLQLSDRFMAVCFKQETAPHQHTLGNTSMSRMWRCTDDGSSSAHASKNCSRGSGSLGSHVFVMAVESLGSTVAASSCVYGSSEVCGDRS